MTINDCFARKPVSRDVIAAEKLGILSYISKYEEFENEEEIIKDALCRASAVSLHAYESGQQSYEEFREATLMLEQFCSDHAYDFVECCYDCIINGGGMTL